MTVILKVLIADTDVENIRNFRLYIFKSFPEMRIVGGFSSSASILDEVKKLEPDLIVADIRFFGPQGYGIINDIFDLYPNIRYIVYGYYSDTPYIEKIMQFGVIDYIYRPVKPSDLQRSLKKAVAVFDEMEKAMSDKELGIRELNSAKVAYRDIFLSSLTEGNIAEAFEIKNNFLYFNIELHSPFTVLLLKIDHFRSVILTLDEEEKLYLVHKINRIVKEKLTELNCGVSLIQKLHINTIIVGSISDQSELYKLAEKIKNEVALRAKVSVTIGIGRTYEDYSGISVSYLEAEAALRHRYYMGYNIVIPLQYAEPNNKISYVCPVEKESRLVYASVSGEYEYSLQLLKQICDSLRQQNLPDGLLPKIIMDIIISINRFINERDLISLDNFTEIFPTAKVLSIKSINEAYEFMAGCFKDFCASMNELRLSHGKKIVKTAKEFIAENYNRNISISEIAFFSEAVPEYFSRIFSELEKISVYDYITELRIKNARKMLEESSLEEVVIGQLVGFDDFVHFKLVFQQYTGTTPIEYRKRNPRK